MKLLTLNCHSWQEENQMEKIKWIAEAILENEYDCIALQEVSQSIDAKGVKGQLKEDNFAFMILQQLKKMGGPTYHCYWDMSHLAYDTYEEGVAILSKHPIEKARSFYVSRSNSIHQWKSRKIVEAKVRIKNEELLFYSCHLGWWTDVEEPFQDQVDQLLSRINKDKWVFLMGDFNNDANSRNEGYDYLVKSGLYDTYELAKEKDCGITVKGKIAGWNDNHHDLRIDFIFTNRKIPVQTSAVVFNGENRPVVSDHFGVEVEI
ncbi:endonuclease/exonuclease/phosphatase family protein [Bacillus sp. FJAT-47783]|uniref:endonuclease/exonuclease/phosphatase family protein n=1 Tax=Bacillus sp. FJAT-47783 TaxID=2922712 RepID=UPI001FAB678A|nr:endonuclease/exonuclease/phosphatase family protein [Bacillus sp. FJAT-47783]